MGMKAKRRILKCMIRSKPRSGLASLSVQEDFITKSSPLSLSCHIDYDLITFDCLSRSFIFTYSAQSFFSFLLQPKEFSSGAHTTKC